MNSSPILIIGKNGKTGWRVDRDMIREVELGVVVPQERTTG